MCLCVSWFVACDCKNDWRQHKKQLWRQLSNFRVCLFVKSAVIEIRKVAKWERLKTCLGETCAFSHASQRSKNFAVLITYNLDYKSLILFSSPCNKEHFLLHDTFNIYNWIPLTDLCFKQGDDRTGEWKLQEVHGGKISRNTSCIKVLNYFTR